MTYYHKQEKKTESTLRELIIYFFIYCEIFTQVYYVYTQHTTFELYSIC
jgi:hypothetical protein